ncbi:hypothetical protein [Limnohabitans sp. Rim28]|uniref:hypothetical protein n=1 Tax=Limnohabitans sp. Rim28 TaxID=1100720 RepID=UPI001056FB28|nr:hypothetical protein [Limnohabitans sp. Rim28]
MLPKTHMLAPLLLIFFLVGCGGGGGASPQSSSYPLRTGVMNIYGAAWQKSGVVKGTYTYLCTNPPPGTGGMCSTSVTGTFTNTVATGVPANLGGVAVNLISVNRVEITSISGGSTVSYQVGLKPDFSAIVDANGCTLPIPEVVSIGYTAMLNCPNGVRGSGITLSVTADTSSGDAMVTVTSGFGKESYRLAANGFATPVAIGPFSVMSNNQFSSSLNYTLFY